MHTCSLLWPFLSRLKSVLLFYSLECFSLLYTWFLRDIAMSGQDNVPRASANSSVGGEAENSSSVSTSFSAISAASVSQGNDASSSLSAAHSSPILASNSMGAGALSASLASLLAQAETEWLRSPVLSSTRSGCPFGGQRPAYLNPFPPSVVWDQPSGLTYNTQLQPPSVVCEQTINPSGSVSSSNYGLQPTPPSVVRGQTINPSGSVLQQCQMSPSLSVSTGSTVTDSLASLTSAEPQAKKPYDPKGDSESRSLSQYHFRAPKAINEYLEQYFRQAQTDDVFKDMTTSDPRPDCDVMYVPEVEESIQVWLGSKFSNWKSADAHLVKLQRQVLAAAGPLTCLWDDVLSNSSEDCVPKDVVLETIQKTLVLLGDVNANVMCRRRSAILEGALEKPLASATKDVPLPEGGKFLFGENFTKNLGKKSEEQKILTKASGGWKRQQRGGNSSTAPQKQPFRSGSWHSRARTYQRTSYPTSRGRWTKQSRGFVPRDTKSGNRIQQDSRSPTTRQ